MSPFILPLLLLTLTSTAYSALPKPSSHSNYIKSSCTATFYPALCVSSLSTYANKIQQSPKQLAQTALAVSFYKARSAKAYVIQLSKSKGLKRKEYKVLRDCVDNMGDSVDRLYKSIGELGHVWKGSRQESFLWHMSNVQTWVSSALTDDNSCMDGFGGHGLDGKVKSSIRGRITGVAQVTSNALALVNRFADRH